MKLFCNPKTQFKKCEGKNRLNKKSDINTLGGASQIGNNSEISVAEIFHLHKASHFGVSFKF